jgi:hypothetical protein
MKGRLFSMLDPLGRWSPLNPRHRLNPLRSFVQPRKPPGELSSANHCSVLASLYGNGSSLDVVPAPNMEWWWQTIDVETADVRRTRGKYSIITNVQLFGVPLMGWVAQATVAIRDMASGRLWEAHTGGAFDPGANARFTASRWRLGFENADRASAKYVVDVAGDELELNLIIASGPLTSLGDPQGRTGWYDLNPEGLIPFWASYRSRFGSSPGTQRMKLGDKELSITSANARFDQQSLHFSPRDVGAFSLPVLAEAALLRPQWLWYHARLHASDAASSHRNSANLMLCRVVNGHTDQTMKLAAALCDDHGHVALIDSSTIELIQSKDEIPLRGRVRAPQKLRARFKLANDEHLKWWSGQYDVTLTASGNQDWSVRYPIVGPLRYEAQEVPIGVTGSFFSADVRQKRDVTGEGTQEVLDLLKSVTLKS